MKAKRLGKGATGAVNIRPLFYAAQRDRDRVVPAKRDRGNYCNSQNLTESRELDDGYRWKYQEIDKWAVSIEFTSYHNRP
jgi:hypothetical protein